MDANPKIGEKSWRETGRSWTTGIGRPPSLSRSPTGERGGGAACCSSFYCFLFSSVIPVKIGDFDQILICLDENLVIVCQCDTNSNMDVFIISMQIAVWLLRQLNVIEFQIQPKLGQASSDEWDEQWQWSEEGEEEEGRGRVKEWDLKQD